MSDDIEDHIRHIWYAHFEPYKIKILCSICGCEKYPEGACKHSWKCVTVPKKKYTDDTEPSVKIICSVCGVEKEHD